MIEVDTTEPPKRWQWQRTDLNILKDELERQLPPLAPISSEEEIDNRVRDLVRAITRAIEASTPKARPSSRSVTGWTQEYKDAQIVARRLRRRYQRTRTQ